MSFLNFFWIVIFPVFTPFIYKYLGEDRLFPLINRIFIKLNSIALLERVFIYIFVFMILGYVSSFIYYHIPKPFEGFSFSLFVLEPNFFQDLGILLFTILGSYAAFKSYIIKQKEKEDKLYHYRYFIIIVLKRVKNRITFRAEDFKGVYDWEEEELQNFLEDSFFAEDKVSFHDSIFFIFYYKRNSRGEATNPWDSLQLSKRFLQSFAMDFFTEKNKKITNFKNLITSLPNSDQMKNLFYGDLKNLYKDFKKENSLKLKEFIPEDIEFLVFYYSLFTREEKFILNNFSMSKDPYIWLRVNFPFNSLWKLNNISNINFLFKKLPSQKSFEQFITKVISRISYLKEEVEDCFRWNLGYREENYSRYLALVDDYKKIFEDKYLGTLFFYLLFNNFFSYLEENEENHLIEKKIDPFISFKIEPVYKKNIGNIINVLNSLFKNSFHSFNFCLKDNNLYFSMVGYEREEIDKSDSFSKYYNILTPKEIDKMIEDVNNKKWDVFLL